MTLSLMLALGWLVVANVTGMVPSRHKHWPQAYVLIAIGLPILIFVAVESGLIWAILVLLAAMSILRWPVRYLLRWLRAQAFGPRAEG